MSNLHQLSRGITHRNRMRLWVVLCGKGFSTSLPEEGVTVTEVLMKNYFVFGLLLLSSFIYLTNETKQACEGFYDWFMCGNVCLMFYKTCRCGENNEFNQGNGQICCAPSGNCIKDNRGNLFQISQVTKSFFKKKCWICLGNGFCSHGTIQKEGTECHGTCPESDAEFVRLPCQAKSGEIKCSQRIWASKVCKGSVPDICPA